ARGRLRSRRRAGELHLSGCDRDRDAPPLAGVLRRARGGDARTPGGTRAVAADGAPRGDREPGVLPGFGRGGVHDRDGDPGGRWDERGVRENPAYSATPFSFKISQTFSGVMGMSMWRTPRWARASTTALAMAGGAPTVADSPTPLAPKGWCGDGVTVWPVSQCGVSTAVGTRESMKLPPF